MNTDWFGAALQHIQPSTAAIPVGPIAGYLKFPIRFQIFAEFLPCFRVKGGYGDAGALGYR
jgi:hypothetical protein